MRENQLDGNSFGLQISSQNNYSPDMNNVYICNHKVYYEK